jgi:hypothetical protein
MKAKIKPGHTKISTTQGLLPSDVLNKTFLAERFRNTQHTEGTEFDILISITRYKGPMVWAVCSKDLIFIGE